MMPLLDRMHLGYFVSSAGAIRQRTETQAEQALLFQAIGVPEPPRFFLIDLRTSAKSQRDLRLPTSRASAHGILCPFLVSTAVELGNSYVQITDANGATSFSGLTNDDGIIYFTGVQTGVNFTATALSDYGAESAPVTFQARTTIDLTVKGHF